VGVNQIKYLKHIPPLPNLLPRGEEELFVQALMSKFHSKRWDLVGFI